jgi:hypothetical protein
MPETGWHEALHLVCEETQGCEEGAEELRNKTKSFQYTTFNKPIQRWGYIRFYMQKI